MKSTRIMLLLVLLTCCGLDSSAQGLRLDWGITLTGAQGVSASRIVHDDRANVYVMGSFSGTVDFDPGAGTTNLTSDTAFGLGTTFLAKYNAQGNFVFVRQLGPSVSAMALDHAGNICLAGDFFGREDLDPGPNTASYESSSANDIYVARLDSSGNYINGFLVGGPHLDNAEAIAVDAANNIYITGSFSDSVDFDPGPGVTMLKRSGAENIYLAKYSPANSLLFAFRLVSTGGGTDQGVCLAIDASQNIQLGGRFQGTLDLDPGAGAVVVTSRGVDGFIARYDPNGNYLSGFNLDGNVYAIGMDASDHLWVNGTSPDSMDADPGTGRAMLYSVNFFDVYIAKYTAAHSFLYARVFESNKTYVPHGLALMNSGSLYIYGRFPDTVNFNPGGPNGTILSHGLMDGYIAKYNTGGTFTDALAYGSPTDDRLNSMTIDRQGNIWMAGSFTGTMDLDPGTGTTNATSPTAAGAYIVRLKDDETTTTTSATTTPRPQASPRIFQRNQSVIVDFTDLQQVAATITIYNMLGQTIATTHHHQNDMVKLDLPDMAAQLCVVVIDNGGKRTVGKVQIL